jgi:hypothetical protein
MLKIEQANRVKGTSNGKKAEGLLTRQPREERSEPNRALTFFLQSLTIDNFAFD